MSSGTDAWKVWWKVAPSPHGYGWIVHGSDLSILGMSQPRASSDGYCEVFLHIYYSLYHKDMSLMKTGLSMHSALSGTCPLFCTVLSLLNNYKLIHYKYIGGVCWSFKVDPSFSGHNTEQSSASGQEYASYLSAIGSVKYIGGVLTWLIPHKSPNTNSIRTQMAAILVRHGQ